MNNIFCVTSTHSIGCTFLDWSIHYLSGSDKFYNVESGWGELVSTPLSSDNAHTHQKNHPNGIKLTTEVIQRLKKVNANIPLSLYPIPLYEEDAANELNIVINQKSDLFNNEIKYYQQKDYADIWNQLTLNNIPIVYVKLTSDQLFLQSIRQFDRNFPSIEIQPQTSNEVHAEFLDIFFKDSQINWNKQGMNSTWDQREFISLNIRPREFCEFDSWVNFSTPHYYLDAKELWYNGKDTLINIMQYLNLTVDAGRLITWLPIYSQWQQKQLDILKFVWNVDHICDCIINNYYYDISSYKLDLWHEAIIQHIMIYKHGLNFKTWNLEKFPNNTQDLYKLLEPNIHSVEDIYGIRS